MKILQITDSLANGGAEKFVVELSNELSKNNEVILCSVKSVKSWMIPPGKLDKSVPLVIFGLKKKYSLRLFFRFIRLLKQEKPDVVHIHASLIMPYFSLLAGIFHKINFIHTVHNTLTPGYEKLFNMIRNVPAARKKFIHVCISKTICDLFKNKYPQLYFVKVDNGIFPLKPTIHFKKVIAEIKTKKINNDTQVFVAIGNYSNFKNFILLVEVFRELYIDGKNVILLILGGGEGANAGNFKKVSEKKAPNTFQLGFKKNIGDYLLVADALISSSTHEGMPLVILEALSTGIPVLTTPAGGIVDIIDDEVNGLVAADFSPKSLLLIINKFLKTDPQKIKEIKEANLKLFEKKYTMKVCAKRYETIYNSK